VFLYGPGSKLGVSPPFAGPSLCQVDWMVPRGVLLPEGPELSQVENLAVPREHSNLPAPKWSWADGKTRAEKADCFNSILKAEMVDTKTKSIIEFMKRGRHHI
jgi:hypothetical protein